MPNNFPPLHMNNKDTYSDNWVKLVQNTADSPSLKFTIKKNMPTTQPDSSTQPIVANSILTY